MEVRTGFDFIQRRVQFVTWFLVEGGLVGCGIWRMIYSLPTAAGFRQRKKQYDAILITLTVISVFSCVVYMVNYNH